MHTKTGQSRSYRSPTRQTKGIPSRSSDVGTEMEKGIAALIHLRVDFLAVHSVCPTFCGARVQRAESVRPAAVHSTPRVDSSRVRENRVWVYERARLTAVEVQGFSKNDSSPRSRGPRPLQSPTHCAMNDITMVLQDHFAASNHAISVGHIEGNIDAAVGQVYYVKRISQLAASPL
jgi:hypothetical protein